jgi:hypothetical protein
MHGSKSKQGAPRTYQTFFVERTETKQHVSAIKQQSNESKMERILHKHKAHPILQS